MATTPPREEIVAERGDHDGCDRASPSKYRRENAAGHAARDEARWRRRVLRNHACLRRQVKSMNPNSAVASNRLTLPNWPANEWLQLTACRRFLVADDTWRTWSLRSSSRPQLSHRAFGRCVFLVLSITGLQ